MAKRREPSPMYAVHREIRLLAETNQEHRAADVDERLAAEVAILRVSTNAIAKLPVQSLGYGPRYARFALLTIKRLRAKWMQNEVG